VAHHPEVLGEVDSPAPSRGLEEVPKPPGGSGGEVEVVLGRPPLVPGPPDPACPGGRPRRPGPGGWPRSRPGGRRRTTFSLLRPPDLAGSVGVRPVRPTWRDPGQREWAVPRSPCCPPPGPRRFRYAVVARSPGPRSALTRSARTPVRQLSPVVRGTDTPTSYGPPGRNDEPVNMHTTKEAKEMERDKALDVALSQIEKQFGKGSVMRMGENSTWHRVHPHGRWPSTWPRDRADSPGWIVEVYGPSLGKSTLACTSWRGSAQRRHLRLHRRRARHGPVYATHRVNIDDLLISNRHGEQASRSPTC